jgi:hypothetical protein
VTSVISPSGFVDVGKTPSITVLGPAASVKASALAAAYNIALVANLSGVIASRRANVSFLDTFSLVDVVVADPGAFGLSNVTDPCYVGPLTGGGTVCATPDQYLFWDFWSGLTPGKNWMSNFMRPWPCILEQRLQPIAGDRQKLRARQQAGKRPLPDFDE